jgi:chromosome segregation ATPase
MTEQSQASSTGQSLGRFLRGFVRLVLFALVVALVTVGIYFAVPYIYRYTTLPVQNNRAVIDNLRRTQQQLQDDLSGQLADQRERIAQLESDLAAEREARSELQAELARQAEIVSAQTDLEARLETQGQAITALEQSVDALDTFLTDLDSTVVNVEQALESPERGVARLQRQVLILQMSQAALKARLHLSENNPGQARLVLENVNQDLQQLAALTPSEKREDLSQIREQLAAVVTAIEEQPFIATQELEILSQLLQQFSTDEE